MKVRGWRWLRDQVQVWCDECGDIFYVDPVHDDLGGWATCSNGHRTQIYKDR